MNAPLYIDDQGACLLDGIPLHPPQEPLEEARAELRPLMESAGPRDILVLAGLGLGWHARAALEWEGGPDLAAYEPDPRRRAMLVALGPHLPGLEIAPDLDVLCEQLGDKLVYGDPGRVAIFSPQAYRLAQPQVERDVRELVQRTLSRGRANRAALEVNADRWRRRAAANFKHVLQCPDVTLLAGAMSGVPAVVAGAGPSLDLSLPELAGIHERVLLLSAASALGPLAGAGAISHFAAALEAKDESRQFAGADAGRTILAAAVSGHANHFTRWPGMTALFHLQPWTADLAGMGRALAAGGHATSAAFSLALIWGCDPIILAGQDLAYSNGRIHASGRPGGEEEDRPETIWTKAIGGGLVKTSQIMQSYITWYQEAAGFLRRRGKERRIINATAQGALIPGLEHRPLAECLAGLPPSDLSHERLRAAVGGLPRPSEAFLAQRLSRARVEARSLLTVLDSEGAAAVLARAGEDSPAGAALAGLTGETPPETVQQRLLEVIQDLRAMEEGLYA